MLCYLLHNLNFVTPPLTICRAKFTLSLLRIQLALKYNNKYYNKHYNKIQFTKTSY